MTNVGQNKEPPSQDLREALEPVYFTAINGYAMFVVKYVNSATTALISFILTFGICSVSASSNEALDQCRDVLKNGFIENFTKISQSSRNSTEKTYFCSASLNEAKDYFSKNTSSGSSASGSVTYGLFSAGGGGGSASAENLTEEKYRKWKSVNCGGLDKADAANAFDYTARSTVASSVVQAWRDCIIAKDGLSCWASPFDDVVVVSAFWKKDRSATPTAKITASYLSNGESQSAGGKRKILVSTNTTLLNEKKIVINNFDRKKSIVATIEVQHDGASYGCETFVPSKEDLVAHPANDPWATVVPLSMVSGVAKCTVRSNDPPCTSAAKLVLKSTESFCSYEIKYDAGPNNNADAKLSRLPDEQTLELIVRARPTLAWEFKGRSWVDAHIEATVVPAEMPAAVRLAKGCKL